MIVKGSEFVPAPDGVANAVCVDEVDLGIVASTFGPKHMLKLVWEIEELMENGKRFLVSKRYAASLHEKATLHKDLKSWRGKAFTPDELKAFDLANVVGKPCQLVIVHAEKDGSVYANVQTVAKAGAVKLTPSGNYIRVKDRPPEQQNGNGSRPANGQANGHHEEVAEEIPF